MHAQRSLDQIFVRVANGEHVVIRWVFEFTGLGGRKNRIEELAWQRWEGEQIAQETFSMTQCGSNVLETSFDA